MGAGAIGCELLKNMALMGVGCPIEKSPDDKDDNWFGGSQGGILVADMDHIGTVDGQILLIQGILTLCYL